MSVFQRAKQKELIWTKKRFYNGLNMAAAQVSISIGYYFNHIYVGLVLEICRFPLVSCMQGSTRQNQLTRTLQNNGNVCRAAKFHFPNPTDKDLELSAGEGSCLRLCGPALNRIIESNVHFEQHFVI